MTDNPQNDQWVKKKPYVVPSWMDDKSITVIGYDQYAYWAQDHQNLNYPWQYEEKLEFFARFRRMQNEKAIWFERIQEPESLSGLTKEARTVLIRPKWDWIEQPMTSSLELEMALIFEFGLPMPSPWVPIVNDLNWRQFEDRPMVTISYLNQMLESLKFYDNLLDNKTMEKVKLYKFAIHQPVESKPIEKNLIDYWNMIVPSFFSIPQNIQSKPNIMT